ncbi:MAG: hypothetical protein ICV59_01450 [Thermoleophilia bacterium]|nr:hypothetical protein [Thermoleophilia bacterium]
MRSLIVLVLASCALAAPGTARADDELAALVAAASETASGIAGAGAADVVAAADQNVGEAQTSLGTPAPPSESTQSAPAAPDAQYLPQYQLETPQYQPEKLEYQPEPASTPEPPPAGATAPAQPVNVNVSVRVLSPGNDGPVSQTVGSSAAPGVAVHAEAGGSISVTVNVNVNVRSDQVWTFITQQLRYHEPDEQYRDGDWIESWIAGPIDSDTDRWNGLAIDDDASLPAAAELPHTSSPRARPSVMGRGKAAAPRRAAPLRLAPVRMGVVPVRMASASTSVAPIFAPTSPAEPVRRRATDGGELQLRSAGRSAPRTPSEERLAGSSASLGGSAAAFFFKMLAILVTSLGIAALTAARRLRLPASPGQGIDGPGPDPPG